MLFERLNEADVRYASCSPSTQYQPNLLARQAPRDPCKIVHVRWPTWTKRSQPAILFDPGFDPFPKMLEGSDGGGIVHRRRGFVRCDDAGQLHVMVCVQPGSILENEQPFQFSASFSCLPSTTAWSNPEPLFDHHAVRSTLFEPSFWSRGVAFLPCQWRICLNARYVPYSPREGSSPIPDVSRS